jgi:hypothetical protein
VRLPAVVTGVIALPFDQVFHATVAHATVKDRLNVVLSFTVDEDRIRRRDCATAWEGVIGCESQLNDREVGSEAAHGEGESETISIATNTPFNLIWAQHTIRKLG